MKATLRLHEATMKQNVLAKTPRPAEQPTESCSYMPRHMELAKSMDMVSITFHVDHDLQPTIQHDVCGLEAIRHWVAESLQVLATQCNVHKAQ